MVFLISELQSQEGWYQQDTGTNSLLMDVFFTDVLEGWTVGITNTILHTTDGGETWTPQDSPPSVNYYSTYFIDNLTGTAVGADVGGGGEIRRTVDGGENWTTIVGPSLYSLWCVFFIDENNGWIAGGRESGYMIDPIRTIHKTDDGGLSWYTQLYQYDELPLHGIHFYDLNTGCAVGEHGTIFWTDDGGNEWVAQESGEVDHLWGVQLLNDSTAWTVGVNDLVLNTQNGGSNWTSYATGLNCGWSDICFPDNLNGWMVGGITGEAKILYTPDAGGSWIEQEAGSEHSLTSVHFADNLNGWATGNIGTMLHTDDGGGVVAVEEDLPNSEINIAVELQSYPNPFNPETIISFQLPENSDVELGIYNLKGQKVKQLVSEQLTAGKHFIVWDGKDNYGKSVSSGIYFYKLKTDNFEKTKKMILMK